MFTIDNEEFERNLLLTQAYCEMQLANTEKSPAEILRSFNPMYNRQPIFSFIEGQYSDTEFNYKSAGWTIYPFGAGNDYLYSDLFEMQLKDKESNVKLNRISNRFSGRILIADIDSAIPDGASEQVSLGFIDENDCPPIDTWFFLSLEDQWVLYAWIPEQFVSLVDAGIDVNALDVFYWKDEPRSGANMSTDR